MLRSDVPAAAWLDQDSCMAQPKPTRKLAKKSPLPTFSTSLMTRRSRWGRSVACKRATWGAAGGGGQLPVRYIPTGAAFQPQLRTFLHGNVLFTLHRQVLAQVQLASCPHCPLSAYCQAVPGGAAAGTHRLGVLHVVVRLKVLAAQQAEIGTMIQTDSWSHRCALVGVSIQDLANKHQRACNAKGALQATPTTANHSNSH